MTYDEVEKIIGRPSSIERGFTELLDATNSYNVDTKGQLLYVRWEYNNISKTESRNDFIYQKEYEESLKRVDADSSDVEFYQNQSDNATTELSKTHYLDELTSKKESFENSKQEFIKLDSLKKHSSPKKTPENYNRFSIKYIWCILFDSASGRVTQQGYFPIFVNRK